MANGHVIKCTTTGKIRICMLDGTGARFAAVLVDVMYVPGLSRRLFSITKFGKHGHYAIVRGASTTLYFGKNEFPVTLSPLHGRDQLASDSCVVKLKNNEGPTLMRVPTMRSRDHSCKRKRVPIELLHARLGHRKCRTLLAASEHGLWADTQIHAWKRRHRVPQLRRRHFTFHCS